MSHPERAAAEAGLAAGGHAAHPEGRIAAAMRSCVHFTGLLGTIHEPREGRTCRAGVVYDGVKDESLTGLERYPCFAESTATTCPQRRIRTREEAVAHLDAAEAREAAIPVDPVAGCKYETLADGTRVALVMQMGYRCLHGELRPSVEKLQEAGFTRYRIRMFADSAGRCPRCETKRAKPTTTTGAPT